MEKQLYSFTVLQDKETFVEEKKVDEASQEETTVRRKVVVQSPVEVIIKKPTRRQMEEADLEYSVEMSRGIKKGLLTKAMLMKRYSDNGGLMAESESKRLVELYQDLYKAQSETARLQGLEKSEENESAITSSTSLETSLKKEIVQVESSYRSLFDHTADSKAQNRALLWHIINLTWVKKEGDAEASAYFKGKDFEAKLEDFYAKEEEASDLYLKVTKKITTLVAFWFFDQAKTKEEFDELNAKIDAGEY